MKISKYLDMLTNIPYPNKEDYVVYHVMKKGKIIHQGVTLNELKEIYDTNPLSRLKSQKFVVEQETDEEGFRLKQKEYYAQQANVSSIFKQDLFEDYGVSGPKAEQLYNICANRDSNFDSIECDFSDFVELITN
jgi:hypothetical protein